MEITNANWKKILIDRDRYVILGDIVVFNVKKRNYVYKVYSDHLGGENCLNDDIFDAIGKSKIHFCEKYYGYKPLPGNWPASADEDYFALTRVVIALFKEIEGKEILKVEADPTLKEVPEDPIEKSSGITISVQSIQTIKIIL